MLKVSVSEAVRKGHPDKLCDILTDSIVDYVLSKDPEAKVGVDACATAGDNITLMGKICTNHKAICNLVEINDLVESTLRSIGYTNYSSGLNCKAYTLENLISFIHNDGLSNKDLIADDYCVAVGYATSETESMLPLSLFFANALAEALDDYGKLNPYINPDGKVQVSVAYDGTGHVDHIQCVSVKLHTEDLLPGVFDTCIYDVKRIIQDTADCWSLEELLTDDTSYVIAADADGGPRYHQGLSGRKIGLDTYCGHAKFVGGALSGKTLNKLDRSAAYLTRYIAKHIVSSGIAKKCEVELSYAAGEVNPINFNVNTFNTSMVPDDILADTIMDRHVFDMTPGGIAKAFSTNNEGIAKLTNYYNHFYNQHNPWEQIDKSIVEQIKSIKSEYLGSYCEN